MQTIHTNKTINITDLKKNPIQVANEVTCVLSRGKPVFYCVPADEYAENRVPADHVILPMEPCDKVITMIGKSRQESTMIYKAILKAAQG